MKHGFTVGGIRHPLYNKWRCMKARCLDVNNIGYSHYGGRGISVCREWMSSSSFIDWAMSNGWIDGLQLDRIDNNGNYEPSNCRFVTPSENNCNKRRSKNSGRYIGITEIPSGFVAAITISRKTKYIGTFSNPVDAAVNRDSYIINNNLGRSLNFKQPIQRIT